MFRVGQNVEQIADWNDGDTGYTDVVFTRCGQIYTIREVLLINGMEALLFFEIVNPQHDYRGRGVLEQPFPAWNFRPVVERKTDISVFTDILRKINTRINA